MLVVPMIIGTVVVVIVFVACVDRCGYQLPI